MRPIIITGLLSVLMVGVILWVFHPDACIIDASHMFMDWNKPNDPTDDYPFGFVIGDC
jgi:hypothetical protein